MEYRCLEMEKRLIFTIEINNIKDEDIDYFLTDLSFLKDLSLFLYKETQKKEVKYCSDTLMLFLFKYFENPLDPLDPFILGLPFLKNLNNITHFNKINDVIVELRFKIECFNVVDLAKKYLINNSNFLQVYNTDNSAKSIILNMDPILSDPENSLSLDKDMLTLLLYSDGAINYCCREFPIKEEALEKLMDYKKEKNKEEYVLLKMMKESIQ